MPHTPFSSPLLVVFDTMRVYTMTTGLMLCVLSGALAFRARVWQSVRFLALAVSLLAASVIGSEFMRMGYDTITYRLITNAVGSTVGLWAVTRLVTKRLPRGPSESP